MSRKVINITHSANKYDILSQTPKNYDKDNYFLKELQDKVDAEWKYRPNRVDIEYENAWGKQTYTPIEVVMQSVISEKGKAISNDVRNLVFQNILEDRFTIGNRFRFSDNYNLSEDENLKNIWLVVNTDKASMTSSVVVGRCNGTLGSTVQNKDGTVSYHYEPVIQGTDLTAVNFFYNETLISPQSQLLVIAQHNEYTKTYQINQRFIVGYDKVYRIKAINKFYGNSTFWENSSDPKKVGLMRIYMEICEDTSEYDDFVHRIAYQSDLENRVQAPIEGEYSIQFIQPQEMTNYLTEDGLTFEPVLKLGNEAVTADFTFNAELQNLPASSSISRYVEIENEGNNIVSVSKIRDYIRGNLVLTWDAKVSGETKSQIKLEFYVYEQ